MLPFDSTDPGLINVADQAYPIVPATQQSLPTPRNVLGSDFAPPLPPLFSAGGPTPTDAFVANTANKPPSFSMGTAIPVLPSIDVGTEVLIDQPVADWLVTDAGNFQTSNTTGDLQAFVISAVVAFDVGLPTERYQVFLGANTNLFLIGVDLTQSLAYFNDNLSQLPPIPTSPPPPKTPAIRVVNPTRPIINFGTNWILVAAIDSFGFMLGGTFANPWNPLSQPTAGQNVQINILRDGPDVINDTNLPEINVLVGTPQQPPPPVLGTVFNFTGNFVASSGVVTPFIGSGQALPPLIGTFEVENQSLVGQGLPTNVFV